MNNKLLLGLVLLLLSVSCSNRSLYNSVQLNNIQRCQALPIPQQAACQAQYQTSFEEYSRQRAELEAEIED